jgi:hypothetical protein
VNSEFFFEPSSKLRKGFPSETRVKRGFPRDPLRERTLREAPAGMISVRAAPAAGFKKCCMQTGQYDGARRNHYQR